MRLTVPPAAVKASQRIVPLPAASPYRVMLIGTASMASPAEAARPSSQNQRSDRRQRLSISLVSPRNFDSASAGMNRTVSEVASIVTSWTIGSPRL
ncbi:hypothetical protein D3C71_1997070 [compost metagenome]